MRELKRESNKRYVVYSKGKSTGWMIEDTFSSLEDAEKEASRVSRNAYDAKVIDTETGKVVSKFHDFLKKEDNNYSLNMGVDDIEDVIAAGLDWTQDDFKIPSDEPRDYDDPSKLVTIAQAEKIIGERPDASKPKPPTSKNPRPDTLRKYQDAVRSYKDRVKALASWEKEYDRLVAQAQTLKNIQDQLDDIREDLIDWCTRNPGTFILRKTMKKYSRIQDPVDALEDIVSKFNIPEEIESLENNPKWMINNIDLDEDDSLFPSILITLDKEQLRVISISDDLNDISMLIEDYVDSIQPKDILSITEAKLDQKSTMTLRSWQNQSITNSKLDENGQALKLYLVSVCFEKEIQQLNKYPTYSEVSPLVYGILRQV